MVLAVERGFVFGESLRSIVMVFGVDGDKLLIEMTDTVMGLGFSKGIAVLC